METNQNILSNRDDAAQVMAWLRRRPSAQELRTAFPEEWDVMEAQLQRALVERDPARLHELLRPATRQSREPRGWGGALRKQDARATARAAVRQRMAALAIERYALAAATGRSPDRMRFNLFNGLLAQRLLFRRGFERKPVSLFWFKILWPLVWQKRLLMPLVERKGIYCFYSRAFVRRVAALAAGRRCLEIAAGDGTLTRFLRDAGVAVTATDDHSWRDRIDFPADVERLDAVSALRRHGPQVVLCSWPPASNAFEREVFRCASVEVYLVIASIHRFASGNWGDYDSQQAFTMERRPDLGRLLLPPELGCEVLLFRRKESSLGDREARVDTL